MKQISLLRIHDQHLHHGQATLPISPDSLNISNIPSAARSSLDLSSPIQTLYLRPDASLPDLLNQAAEASAEDWILVLYEGERLTYPEALSDFLQDPQAPAAMVTVVESGAGDRVTQWLEPRLYDRRRARWAFDVSPEPVDLPSAAATGARILRQAPALDRARAIDDLRWLRRAHKEAPDEPHHLFHAARLLRELGEWEAALPLLQRYPPGGLALRGAGGSAAWCRGSAAPSASPMRSSPAHSVAARPVGA